MAELSTANSISNEDWLERIRRLPLRLLAPGRQLCSTDRQRMTSFPRRL